MKSLFLFLISLPSAWAQTSLTGEVRDAVGKPVSFANVLLLRASDSVFVKGSVASEKGQYRFDRIQAGQYRLAASMVGYRLTKSDVFVVTDSPAVLTLPPLTLSEAPKQLNEVAVTTQKPLFEQQLDRMVINVQSSITSSGSTVLDILERSPGVAVDRQNNTLAMNGKQGVMVMLNGKLSRVPMASLMQLLGGMNAGNIEKVELITTPPAQYDAEGNAGLINIVTKRSPNLGTNGSWSANFGYGKWERAGIAVNISRRTEKLSLFADYSGQMNHFLRPSGGNRLLTQPIPLETSLTIRRDQRDWVHNGQLGLEASLSAKTTLGALATLQNIQSNQLADNSALTIQAGKLIMRVDVRDEELNDTWIYTGNLNLRHKWTPKQEISADVDFIRFFNNNPHHYIFNYEYPQEDRRTTELASNEKRTPIQLWVAKTDYSQTLGKTGKLETGAKATFASFDNNIQFKRNRDGLWATDPDLTQHVQMSENIWAGYVNTERATDGQNAVSGWTALRTYRNRPAQCRWKTTCLSQLRQLVPNSILGA